MHWFESNLNQNLKIQLHISQQYKQSQQFSQSWAASGLSFTVTRHLAAAKHTYE